MNSQQQIATIEVPVVIPPELAELTRDLITLKDELRREIDIYRENRGQISWSEAELAEYFGISLVSMERIRRDGRISYTRIAGKIRYTRSHIEEYLEKEQTKRKGKK